MPFLAHQPPCITMGCALRLHVLCPVLSPVLNGRCSRGWYHNRLEAGLRSEGEQWTSILLLARLVPMRHITPSLRRPGCCARSARLFAARGIARDIPHTAPSAVFPLLPRLPAL
ncbi:hypothetical protein LIA77_09669 [Sarocladium implicatum]|nr:hypothetical protein LIA77_09669 [Sarocladium implicatum]